MGLQNQLLNEVSSESLPILLITLLINSISFFNHLFFNLLRLFVIQPHSDHRDDDFEAHGDATICLASDLQGQVTLSEQRKLNQIQSYEFVKTESVMASDCIVCLCKLRDGEKVRKLECRHVFHKLCFDGWLDHLNFNCPLCRSSL